MNDDMKRCGLVVFCLSIVFLAGCFPEDSLQWSSDGSRGVLKMGELIGLVDGETGEFKPIEIGRIHPVNISISTDGKLVAYSLAVVGSSLNDALKQLSLNQANLLEHYAEKMRAEIIRRGSAEDLDLAKMDLGPFRAEAYHDWLKRYVYENADEELTRILTPEAAQKGKGQQLVIYKLFVATPVAAIKGQSRPVTTSIFMIFSPKISPDNKLVAYTLYNDPYKQETFRFDLYAAQLGSDIEAMHIADYVAPGYSWCGDSKAIAVLGNSIKEMTEDYSIGTLHVTEVANGNGLLTKPVAVESAERGSVETHCNSGRVDDLVRIIFHPSMNVQCTADRIFFSSHGVNLPMSTISSDRCWSIYCYDRLTGSVSKVLPREVSDSLGGDAGMGDFAVSPDGKRVLLPIRKYRFMIYKFGDSSAVSPIKESEEFGGSHGDNRRMMPAWKGSDQITTLVSTNSHFLTKGDRANHGREEVVILGAGGTFNRVLSEKWPKR